MYCCINTQCFTHRNLSDLGSSSQKMELRTNLSFTCLIRKDQLMAARATFIALDLSTLFSYLKQSHVA